MTDHEGPLKVDGYYVLTADRSLLWNGLEDGPAQFLADDRIVAYWPLDLGDRESAWTIAVEAAASDVSKARLEQLAGTWNLIDSDGVVYAGRVGAKVERSVPGGDWMATRADGTGPAGYGLTVYEALGRLAAALGYVPEKVGAPSFSTLLRRTTSGGAGGAGGAHVTVYADEAET